MEHKDPAREAIAAEVRASLARANQPASWLADRAGISKTALSLKLKAQRSFTVEELLSVADALGIDKNKGEFVTRIVQGEAADKAGLREEARHNLRILHPERY